MLWAPILLKVEDPRVSLTFISITALTIYPSLIAISKRCDFTADAGIQARQAVVGIACE
jgi:hypothetical protein